MIGATALHAGCGDNTAAASVALNTAFIRMRHYFEIYNGWLLIAINSVFNGGPVEDFRKGLSPPAPAILILSVHHLKTMGCHDEDQPLVAVPSNPCINACFIIIRHFFSYQAIK